MNKPEKRLTSIKQLNQFLVENDIKKYHKEARKEAVELAKEAGSSNSDFYKKHRVELYVKNIPENNAYINIEQVLDYITGSTNVELIIMAYKACIRKILHEKGFKCLFKILSDISKQLS